MALLDTTAMVDSGALDVTLTSTSTSFRLVASSPFGGADQTIAIVGQPPRRIDAFEVRGLVDLGLHERLRLLRGSATSVTARQGHRVHDRSPQAPLTQKRLPLHSAPAMQVAPRGLSLTQFATSQ